MITQAQWEAHLRLTAGTDVAILTVLEASAVEWLEQTCNRYFGLLTTGGSTEEIIGDGSEDLWLAEAPNPATVPSDLEERAYIGSSPVTITASDSNGFELRTGARNTARLVRKLGGCWEWGYRFTVAYEYGYAQDAEPQDIRQAVLDLMALMYLETLAPGGGSSGGGAAGPIQSEKIGDYSYVLGAAAGSSSTIGGVSAASRHARIMQTVHNWKRYSW